MKLPPLCAALILAPILGAQELTVPDFPADHVLDQTGKVTTAERKAVTTALQPVASQDGLGIYLVLLNSAAEEPPADVARRLAQGWRTTPDTAVVLSAPSLDPPLLLEVAGVALGSLAEENLEAMKSAALEAGKQAGTGVPAMLAAAQSMAAQVRAFRQGTAPSTPSTASATPAASDNQWVAWVAGGALTASLLALVLMRRGRQRALIFPPTEFRHRFSAPHSGGNNAMISFGKRRE